MKFARLTSRIAVGGVAAALATAGLVGVTSTSASAASASTNYTCAVPVLGDRTFPVTVNVPLLPSTAPAGFPVPAGLLSFDSTITIPADVVALLGDSANGAKSDDFSTAFGAVSVKAPVAWNTPPTTPPGPGESATYSGKGSNGAFALPEAGTYSVGMPKTFTLTPTKDGAALPINVSCTSATPDSLGTITLSKQASTVKGKAPKSVKVGTVVTVKGKVTNEYVKTGGVAPTGKLVIKDGKKKVGKGKVGKNGKFKIKVKGLKVGKHKLVVLYKGDKFTAKGKSKAIKLTVKK
jgi:hypothetical protein